MLSIKVTVFWDVALCSLIDGCSCVFLKLLIERFRV